MKCRKCGEELPDRARFCLSCGAPTEDIPATKKLEEPLDPEDAGAVPLVPVAPPPRATRMAPRQPRAHSPYSDQCQVRSTSAVYRPAALSEEDVDEDGEAEDTAAHAPIRRRSAASRAAAQARIGARRLRRRLASFQPSPSVVTAFFVVLGVALLVFVVYSSTSWFGPFALRGSGETTAEPPVSSDTGETEGDEGPAASEGNEGLVVRDSVEDYSWDELSQLADLIASAQSDEAGLSVAKTFHLCDSSGKLDGTQTKELELLDGTTVTMRVVGFRQDSRSDGEGVAGITFLAEGSVGLRSMNSSAQVAGGWAGSELRAWMNDGLVDLLPDEVASEVVAVDKAANAVAGLGGAQTTTSDTLWVPSYSEIVGELSAGNKRYGLYEQEGEQYQLFSDMAVDWNGANAVLACSDYWWLRTPDPSNGSWYMCVTPDGLPTYGHLPATENAVLMGFCL